MVVVVGGLSNEMGAGRKERLYLCLGFLAAEDLAWVVSRMAAC